MGLPFIPCDYFPTIIDRHLLGLTLRSTEELVEGLKGQRGMGEFKIGL